MHGCEGLDSFFRRGRRHVTTHRVYKRAESPSRWPPLDRIDRSARNRMMRGFAQDPSHLGNVELGSRASIACAGAMIAAVPIRREIFFCLAAGFEIVSVGQAVVVFHMEPQRRSMPRDGAVRITRGVQRFIQRGKPAVEAPAAHSGNYEEIPRACGRNIAYADTFSAFAIALVGSMIQQFAR